VLSAFVAFRMFVFLVPFVYVLVAGLGLYGSSQPGGTQDVIERAGAGAAIASSLANAMEASDRGRWLALILGIGALLWASLGVTKSLYAVHQVAWRLPRRRMTTTVGAVVGPIFFVMAAIATSAAAAAIRDRNAAWGLAATVGVFVAFAGLWLLASIILPREPGTPWTALLPGAVLLAVGLQGLHVAVVFYFAAKLSRASEAYGALGVALVVLAWLFLIGRLAVAAAALNAALWEQHAVRQVEAEHRLRIDPDGRIAIPRQLRDEWGIDASDQLVVEREGESIRLAPVRNPGSSPSEPPAPRP